jgi:hypothetical protein
MVAFIECLEAVTGDSGKMDENIRSLFLLDEAVTLAAVEPFYDTIGHVNFLLSLSSQSFTLQEAT